MNLWGAVSIGVITAASGLVWNKDRQFQPNPFSNLTSPRRGG
jgi:hypothetical protein